MRQPSKAFEKAIALTEQKPLPKDIVDQLERLRFEIDIWEHDRFGWLYEGLTLDEGVELPVFDDTDDDGF